MSDTVIAPDLRKRYDDLIHRRNQCLMRGNLMQRAEYWMDYEDREVAFIERVSKAEQENVALRAKVAKLEAPVSQAEVEEFFHKDDWGLPYVYKNAFDLVIAARGREGE